MNHSKRNILIVEDDEIIASIYQKKFEKAGFDVEVAADGQAGFYRVHELRPNVVLLDLMLPHMNGLEILKKMRAQKRFETMPVFVFTNAFLSDIAQEAASAGANRVFNKATTTPQQIIDAVESALAPSSMDPNESAYSGAPRPPAAQAPPPIPSPAQNMPIYGSERDAEFQADLRKSFLDASPATLGTLREFFTAFTKGADDNSRDQALLDLYRKVHSLTGSAAITGLKAISQMCAAMEALLKELHEKPANINASTMRTVALAIDFLGFLFQNPGKAEGNDPVPFNILVVDDEIISRRAVVYALEKASLKSIAVEDSQIAYDLLKENAFDLVILDVEMPGMDGFELCSKLRELAAHKTTPVVFVTSLSDFESRAKSSVSGGNDLIGKPFLFMELAVKALTYTLKGRMNHTRSSADQAAAAHG